LTTISRSGRALEALFLCDGFAIAGMAANGKEAIDLAKKIAPDLIVLDLSMPVLNGLDAAPQLRAVAPKARSYS
jgi:two-component system response regulator YesN